MRKMASVHLRNAMGMLDKLLHRDDINAEVKGIIARIKSEVIAAQDEMLWARGRAREAFQVLEELVELLGAEVKVRKARLIKDVYMRQIEASPHLEAVIEEDGKVKIEKVAMAKSR